MTVQAFFFPDLEIAMGSDIDPLRFSTCQEANIRQRTFLQDVQPCSRSRVPECAKMILVPRCTVSIEITDPRVEMATQAERHIGNEKTYNLITPARGRGFPEAGWNLGTGRRDI